MNRNRMMLANTIIVIITIALNTILGMVEIKLFLEAYGTLINGLIQTANQVLGYLVLIESGICAAYLYKFYKPISENDTEKMSSLYNGFLNTMKRVVYKMLAVAVLICFIYPIILVIRNKSDVNYLTMVSIFVMLSIRAILPYRLTMVPKYMIVLKEKKYKAELISGTTKSFQFIAEIIIIIYFKPPIQVLLFTTVIITLITGLWFQLEMKKLYKGQLKDHAKPDYKPNAMSKDILAHNISALAFNSTDNIIISMFSLENVTIYSSYNMIAQKAVELIQKVIEGASATFGIKIAANHKNSYELYRELLSGIYYLAGIITTVFVVMINDFIKLWIGEKYVAETLDAVLFGFILYTGILLPILYVARNAKGLFHESRNFTIAQAVLNIIITVLLVPIIGITGALIGTLLGRVLISVPMNYTLVYKRVFPGRKSRIFELISNTILVFSSIFITNFIVNFYRFEGFSPVITFAIKTGVSTITSVLIMSVYYFVIYKSFRGLLERVIKMIKIGH